MAYATYEEVQARCNNEIAESLCETLLEDASIIIDCYNENADESRKKLVAISMVKRVVDSVSDVPIGASQGTMSALGYSQSWTLGSSGASGELYMSKLDKKLLGAGNSIASRSPLEEITND